MDTELPKNQKERTGNAGLLSQALRRKGLGAAIEPHVETDRVSPRRIRPVFLVIQAGVAFGIVLAAAFGMQAMIAEREAPPQRAVREQTFTVQIVEAQSGRHQPEIAVFGEISAANNVEIRAELAAPVIEIGSGVERGAVVSALDLIARLDPFEFESAIADAIAALAEANARLDEGNSRLAALATELKTAIAQRELAERDLARAKELIERGSITQQTLDQRQQALLQRDAAVQTAESSRKTEEARRDQLKSAIERAEIQLKRAERNLEKTVIRAPVTGVINSEALSTGQLVSNNQIIADLVELGSFEASFTLSDDQYGRLTAQSGQIIGTPVNVVWRVGDRAVAYEAEISRVAPTISADRGGVSVYARLISLPNDTDIRPGAFVEIILADRVYDNVIRVPESALYDEERVYVVSEERLSAVSVTPLAFDGDDVLILAEIDDGTPIMTTRIAEAGNGVKVRISGSGSSEPERPEGGPKVEGSRS